MSRFDLVFRDFVDALETAGDEEGVGENGSGRKVYSADLGGGRWSFIGLSSSSTLHGDEIGE